MTASWQTDGNTISRAARPGDIVYRESMSDRGQVVAVYDRHVTARMCWYSETVSDWCAEVGEGDPKGEPLWYLSSLGRAD